jgi:DNA-binding beta-propeller fold protein YncE
VAVDGKGFIYIADTMNARVQKFDPDGNFVMAFGVLGEGEGQLKEPNGVIVDKSGLIYVTDALNHKLVRYDQDGKFLKEWKNPEVGFYGPRDLAYGSNGMLYIIDQGHTRIATFDPTLETFNMWGTAGSGPGQFNESTGICAAENLLVVTDTGNNRIQVFNLDGTFVRQWDVPEWQHDAKQFGDAVYDPVTKRLYVSSKTNEILAYDLEGKPQPGIKPGEDNKLDLPSSMVITETGNKRRLLVLNTGGGKLSSFDLEPAKKEPEKKEPANKGKG